MLRMMEINLMNIKNVLDSPVAHKRNITLQKCTFALEMGIKWGFSFSGVYQTSSNESPMVFIPSSRPNYKI